MKVGDIFEIRFSDGSRAYGRYVFRHKAVGPLVEIYDLRLAEGEEFSRDRIKDAPLKFPPVFAGINPAVREGTWKVVDHVPVKDFRFPMFLSAHRGRDPFVIEEWLLWDGEKYQKLGKRLPEQYAALEMVVGWSAADLTRRIETGVDHFRVRLRDAT